VVVKVVIGVGIMVVDSCGWRCIGEEWPKTGWDQPQPVLQWFTHALDSDEPEPDHLRSCRTGTTGPVATSSSPVQLQFFAVHTTGLLNTNHNQPHQLHLDTTTTTPTLPTSHPPCCCLDTITPHPAASTPYLLPHFPSLHPSYYIVAACTFISLHE